VEPTKAVPRRKSLLALVAANDAFPGEMAQTSGIRKEREKERKKEREKEMKRERKRDRESVWRNEAKRKRTQFGENAQRLRRAVFLALRLITAVDNYATLCCGLGQSYYPRR
jgi:Ni/Co efflux regulator RcnB